jgi:hypothetical protein
VATLLRYAAHCASERRRGRCCATAGGAFASPAPRPRDERSAAVARGALADPDTRFRGFHFYPFGSLDATVEWAAAIAAGAFTLDAEGRELVV